MGTAYEPTTPTGVVVEDHEDTACLLRYVLEREGFSVIHVANGEYARHLTTTTPEWQWIQVILLTADSRSETMMQAANLGTTKYILKPFTPEPVIKSVRPFLLRSDRPRELRYA
jgi:DNA-binding response OmpR family regulator